MTADLTPKALDYLDSLLSSPQEADIQKALLKDCRRIITALRAEKETQTARATAAEAALAAAMPEAVRVNSFTLRGALCELFEEYYLWRCSADDDDDGFDLIAAEARLLPSIEPSPASQDREALIAATLESRIYALLRDYRQLEVCDEDGDGYPLVDALTVKGHSIDMGDREIRNIASELAYALAAPPQTDALAARDAKMRAEGMRMAADQRGMWFGFNSQGEPNGDYCTVKAHDPGGMKLYISHDAILAAAQKEAALQRLADLGQEFDAAQKEAEA